MDISDEEWPKEEPSEPLSAIAQAALQQEIADPERLRGLALSIQLNVKVRVLNRVDSD